MKRLSDNIGSLTELLRGSVIESVAVASVAERVWERTSQPGMELTVESVPKIYADREWMALLFESLFQNARDHAAGDVHLRIGALDDGFYVSDDGLGVPADRRDTVFESGYTTLDHGSGYGLRVVHHVTNAHDWELSLTDSATGGLRYEFTRVPVVS